MGESLGFFSHWFALEGFDLGLLLLFLGRKKSPASLVRSLLRTVKVIAANMVVKFLN